MRGGPEAVCLLAPCKTKPNKNTEEQYSKYILPCLFASFSLETPFPSRPLSPHKHLQHTANKQKKAFISTIQYTLLTRPHALASFSLETPFPSPPPLHLGHHISSTQISNQIKSNLRIHTYMCYVCRANNNNVLQRYKQPHSLGQKEELYFCPKTNLQNTYVIMNRTVPVLKISGITRARQSSCFGFFSFCPLFLSPPDFACPIKSLACAETLLA